MLQKNSHAAAAGVDDAPRIAVRPIKRNIVAQYTCYSQPRGVR